MEKKKLKLSITGSSRKTLSSIEQAKSQSKNAVFIERKAGRILRKPSNQKINRGNNFKPQERNIPTKNSFIDQKSIRSDFEKRKLAEQRATRRLKGEAPQKENKLNKTSGKRRELKLTVSRALSDDHAEIKSRSLASLKRAKQKENRNLNQGNDKENYKQIKREVNLPEVITIRELANRMAEQSSNIIKHLFGMGVTGFLAEGFRIALENEPEYEKWSIIGYPLAKLFDGAGNLSGWHQIWWYAHVIFFIGFLVFLPITMLRHIFTSPLNMYLKDRDRPKGAMKPLPNLMETELETFGASVIEDFTWKQLLDTDACTMCGRCTSVCPAHATGKPLDPREIVLKTGEVMAATGDPATTPPIGVDSEITVPANWMFDRVTNDELWSCTSCKACDEICPVNIEILDKILDMRRYKSLMESDFPAELGNAYRAMENSGNPWSISQTERADWIGDMEGIEVIAGGDPFESEWLYWVGCAGSFDDKNKKVSQAMAKLLQRANIDVSILGPAENCTGDPARRSGNEYIFQMLAMQNIETLDSMGVKKIITQCPHCFNTLKNEYPQLGGHYEVIHHTQLLEELIETGQLDMSNASLEERIVYHDSCYLGRHNDVYISPRKVIGSLQGVDIVEAPRNGTKGCLLYTSPSPRDRQKWRMPSSA